jgi:uracil-DNA glycosylase
VIATFHPAYILRQTGGAMNEVKKLVFADLKAVRTRLNEPILQLETAPEQQPLFD